MSMSRFVATKHAVQRYCERVLGKKYREGDGDDFLRDEMERMAAESYSGPDIPAILEPWIPYPMLGGNFAVLHEGTKTAFVCVKNDSGDIAIKTCFRAVCNRCGVHHGLGECKIDRQSPKQVCTKTH